jgi:hypothetical protein
MIDVIATKILILLLIIIYPYVAYKILDLEKYGIGLNEVAIQHWVFNIILVLMPVGLCLDHYQPIWEVFIASQCAYWFPVLIIRYWRNTFTYTDRIWIKLAYSLIYIIFFISIYLLSELYSNVSA